MDFFAVCMFALYTIAARLRSTWVTHQAKAGASWISLLTANLEVSIGLDSFKSFNGIQDAVPSTNFTSRSTHFVVILCFLTPEGRVIHPLDFGIASSVILKLIMPFNVEYVCP